MNHLTKSVGMRVVGTIETNVEVANYMYVDRVRVGDRVRNAPFKPS